MSDLPRANRFDRALAGTFEAREADWRNGAIVYQVLVDRFAPAADLAAKVDRYPAPKLLCEWTDLPRQGRYLEAHRLWSHELEFWGGDLASLMSRLDHVQHLGADVLYLNPIHEAFTNHKYDATDFEAVSPEYGTRDDVVALADELHRRGMRLVLDGVFNHMGRNAPIFRHAAADAASPWRDWFAFGDGYPGGARAWAGALNLPELNLEHRAVRDFLYGHADSVVRRWLRDGVDGWRLDVAHDLGFVVLEQLTQAAHAEKPGSLVVGELCTYPKEWLASVDGVMNFTLCEIVLRTARGQIPAATAGRMIERLVDDCGIEPLLKSWLLLDNHDTPRLTHRLPGERMRHLAQLLQFTLPGAPNLYYGSEVGMTGGDDPEMRAPMRWDLVRDDNPALAWTRQLIALRREHRALRVGNFRRVDATRLLAFERCTDRVEDTVIVIVNPGDEPVHESVMVANSKLMTASPLRNLLQPTHRPEPFAAGLLSVQLPAHGLMVLAPQVAPVGGYTTYKRVQ
ncbi:glycoside hydrolase family 13 protein [Ideonella sp. A 288]|uniref:glycoside hydrolase family 13 protein n=1 Tax=Ideonella sp. A 288 TaxID=1962181 RepID=UPI000B4A79EC|nr:glycoside hydrolase family 13 protein [Ideonella sp. A 288]